VFGVFYYESSHDEQLIVNITPPNAPVIPVNNSAELDSENWAVFGQFSYDMTDRLSLTFGARYTDETKEVTLDAFQGPPASFTTSGLDTVFPAAGAAVRYVDQDLHALDFTNTSIHANARYDWTDTLMTYLSYSEAFKSGGWNPLYNEVQPGLLPTAFNEELAESIELGFKFDVTENLRLNGAVFTTDYTDLQFTYRVGIVPLLFNAGEASIDGAELELTYAPTQNFILEGSVGYLDAAVDSVAVITTATGNEATATVSKGNALPYTPDVSANIGASYRFRLDNGWSLTPRLDVNYVDSQFFDAGNTPEIGQVDTVTTARFALTIEDASEQLRLVLGADNLTDKTYPVAGNSSLTTSSGYAEIVYNRPRTWYASLEYNF
jgi:iron complex outermembrane receptor protein